MTLEPGTKIGDYEILAPLGAGGMGRVYKVRNLISDRVEAMKVLLPDLEGQAELANRFLREIKVQGGLDHPNIAKLYTALRIDNQLLMFMEFVEGITLDQRLQQGPISLADALAYIIEVLSALEYAHQRGIVHRDIKPANMMLLPDGRIKLLDFGIAKAGVDSRLTMTGTTLGSLYYMAPEQIQGGAVDLRSDLYSVGVSLYELVTGKKPFEGDSQFAIMSAHLARTPVPPIQLKSDVPAEVSEIILIALNKDPAARFQTAGAFLNALRTVSPAGAGAAAQRAADTAAARTAPAAVPQAAPPPMWSDSIRMETPAMAAQAVSPPPPPPPAENFHLIEPTDVASRKAGPKRLVWVMVGSLCAVGAIVAYIQFGPRIKTHAKETPPSAAADHVPATNPNLAPPANPPEVANVPAPAASPAPAAAVPEPVAVPQPTPKPQVKSPAPSAPRAPQVAAQRPPAREAQVPPQPTPQAAPPARSAPAAQPPAPAQSAPVAQAPQTTLPDAVNRNRVEVQRLGEQLNLIYIRASTVRDALMDLQNKQAAQGFGPRSDWVEAFNRMNLYLKQATAAVNDGNPTAAAEAMRKAERELDFLEKALGR